MTKLSLVHTHADEQDRRYQDCLCSVCGTVQQCTPWNDFYGEDGSPLKCESCFNDWLQKEHGITSVRTVRGADDVSNDRR